jgi:hypothetical protein
MQSEIQQSTPIGGQFSVQSPHKGDGKCCLDDCSEWSLRDPIWLEVKGSDMLAVFAKMCSELDLHYQLDFWELESCTAYFYECAHNLQGLICSFLSEIKH